MQDRKDFLFQKRANLPFTLPTNSKLKKYFVTLTDTKETPIIESLIKVRKELKNKDLLEQGFWLPNPGYVNMQIVHEKFLKYCLNPNHETSGKSNLFEAFFGITDSTSQQNIDNINILIDKLLWDMLNIENSLCRWELGASGVQYRFLTKILSQPLANRNGERIFVYVSHGWVSRFDEETPNFFYFFLDGVAGLSTCFPRDFGNLKAHERDWVAYKEEYSNRVEPINSIDLSTSGQSGTWLIDDVNSIRNCNDWGTSFPSIQPSPICSSLLVPIPETYRSWFPEWESCYSSTILRSPYPELVGLYGTGLI